MAGLAQPRPRPSVTRVTADLSGRRAPPPRWFALAVIGAVAVGVLLAAQLFGALSAPGASPSPTPPASPLAGQTERACPAALLSGTLVFSELSGVAVEVDGRAVQVAWPAGYGVRQEGASWVLLDEHGRRLARTGDRVEVGGGFVGSGERIWNGCGGVSVLPPPG